MKTMFIIILIILIPTSTLFSQAVVHFKDHTLPVTETKAHQMVLVNINVTNIPNDTFKIVVSHKNGDAGSRDYSMENRDSLILIASKNGSSILSFPITILPDEKEEGTEDFRLYLRYRTNILGRDTDIVIEDSMVVLINDFTPKKQNENPAILYVKRFYYNDSTFIDTIKAVGDDYQFKICQLQACESELISEEISQSEFANLFIRHLKKLTPVNMEKDFSQVYDFADSLYQGWKGKTNVSKQKKEENAANEKFYNELKAIETKVDQLLKGKDTAKADILVSLGKTCVYQRHFTLRDTATINTKDTTDRKKAKKYKKSQEPLYDTTVAYNYTPYPSYEKKDSVNIDSLSIRIENGYITSIVIYPKNDLYNMGNLKLNRVTVIRKFLDLRSAREAAENLDIYLPLESNYTQIRKNSGIMTSKSTNENPQDKILSNYFIYLPDILKYAPRIDSLSDVLIHIKDKNLSFGQKSQKTVTLDDKDFSSFAQLNIFTDLVGLAEDKPNGLIQAEGKFDIGLLTQPIRNSRYYTRSRWNVLHSLSFSVSFTKIENKLKYLIVNNDSVQLFNSETKQYDSVLKKTKNIRTIDLMQFKNLDVSLKLNLVKFESDFTTILLYTGIGINRIPINDTTHGLDSQGKEIISDNKEVYSALKTFGGIKIKNKITSKLGAEWGIDFAHLSLRTDKFKQTYEYYSYDSLRTIVRQQKSKPAFEFQILSPNFLIYYNIDKDLTKRIYIRSTYYYSTRSKTDNFFSFQFGYSTDMKGLVNIFKKE